MREAPSAVCMFDEYWIIAWKLMKKTDRLRHPSIVGYTLAILHLARWNPHLGFGESNDSGCMIHDDRHVTVRPTAERLQHGACSSTALGRDSTKASSRS